MLIVLAILLFLTAAHFIIGVLLAKRNYRLNSKYESTGIINDQNGQTGKRYRFGFFSLKYNGCAPIAVYNAKLLLGMKSRLNDVIYSLEITKAVFLFGLFGGYSKGIKRALKREGLDYTAVSLDETKYDGIYIIKFKNYGKIRNGEHFVTVKTENGMSETYNLCGDGKVYRLPPEKYAGKGYIIGYRIKDGLDKKGNTQQ